MERPLSASAEGLLLEYLKTLQAGQERIERLLGEHTYRLGRLEQVLANLHQQIGRQEEAIVEQGLVLGRLADRIARIERRLELS